MPASVPTTQRAYTLRLSGPKDDDTWRAALWHTHEAVNKGAKVFGDWLLTLRGGLDHGLATATLGKKQPSEDDVRDRRVLLALSWFSVEDARGAPTGFVVVKGDESKEERKKKVLQRFEEILLKRGLTPETAKEWIDDCRDSLCAEIRDDAVWVDRSEAFDEARKQIGNSLTREEVWDVFERFFGSKAHYFAGIEHVSDSLDDSGDEGEQSSASEDEKAKDLVQHAGKWLSNRLGTGSGANFGQMAEAYDALAGAVQKLEKGISGKSAFAHLSVSLAAFQPKSDDLEGIRSLVSGPGHKSATHNLLKRMDDATVTAELIEKIAESAVQDAGHCREKLGVKGPREWSDRMMESVEGATGFSYRHDGPGGARHTEYSVILDHAARKVSAGHSWIKRAESSRLQFEKDKQRLAEVPSEARDFLDGFCNSRTASSGAEGQYRIRRRAVDGWKDVVQAWTSGKSPQERIDRARELQSELEKFGDIQLFEALAADDARCVWQRDGKPDPEILKNYVFARDAEDRMQRFKVPAYRHPDPLRHPVFCDFGNSRWSIDFAVHRAASGAALQKAKQSVEKSEGALEKAKAKRIRAKDEAAASKAQEEIAEIEEKLRRERLDLEWLQNPRSIRLGLWNGAELADLSLRWRSRRFAKDLCIGEEADSLEGVASRSDRAGRAAGAVAELSVPEILGIFKEDYWNGRLQIPRDQLDAVARLLDSGKESQAYNAIQHLDWIISFSAKLQPQGPWIDYAKQTELVRLDPKYWPHSDLNKKRKVRGRLILSRLPNLRLLSVDLGHRYGAICAVWEAVPAKTVVDACRAAGMAPPSAEQMYLIIPRSKDGVRRQEFYRRIGADTLDGKLHPAPWARLERQFTIKLQGEDKPARKPFGDERKAVMVFEQWLGCSRDEGKKFATILDLVMHTVERARLGVSRHGRRARIAWALTSTERHLPGAKKEGFEGNAEIHEDFLADALVEWHGLAQRGKWADAEARELWENYIVPLGAESPKDEEDTPRREQRKAREALKEKLLPVAAALRKNESLRTKLHVAWEQRWSRDDVEWRKKLKWLNRWLLPRGVMVEEAKTGRRRPDAIRLKWIRNVGGLSLERLATIRSLYRVQKQFWMRAEPSDPRKNIPEKGDDSLNDFGKKLLAALEKMREQRVKQLASRIIEAALGIGSEDVRHWSGSKRPQARIGDSRFAPCHAIAIENLTHYRPDETQTRRENRQLMDWSSGKVKKYLQEQCELSGLHLREVQAAYTSRQDSRTGAPGMRCTDVPMIEFLREGGYWQRVVRKATEKKDAERSAPERLLLDLQQLCSETPEPRRWVRSVRVIRRGGEVFASADAGSPIAKGLQADFNAAANIGLKALLDPDWPGAWWYVPCGAKDLIPVSEKIKGAESAFAGNAKQPLREPTTSANEGSKKAKSGKTKEIYNLWRDPGTEPLAPGGWDYHKNYWNEVERRVVKNLRAFNGLPTRAEPPPIEGDIEF